MKKAIFFLLSVIVFASCKTNNVYLNVMEPAPVSMPSSIKNVGVIHRTEPEQEAKVMNKIDEILSAEGPELDKEGAKECIAGVKNELMQNNRFNEIKVLDNVMLKTGNPANFPVPLSWDMVEKICKENKVDVLFSLEMYDTDSKISYSTVPVNIQTPLGSVPAIEHQATMNTLVKTGWRIYDPQSRSLLDEYPISQNINFSGRGINPITAAAALIGRKDAVKQVSNKAAQTYAQRIIPYWIKVTREYYVKGNDNFTIAKRKAQTGNWNAAAELWKKETLNSNHKIAGRACHNMAIVSEINGELGIALNWAKQAYEDHGNKQSIHYVNILKNRIARNSRLQQQIDN